MGPQASCWQSPSTSLALACVYIWVRSSVGCGMTGARQAHRPTMKRPPTDTELR